MDIFKSKIRIKIIYNLAEYGFLSVLQLQSLIKQSYSATRSEVINLHRYGYISQPIKSKYQLNEFKVDETLREEINSVKRRFDKLTKIRLTVKSKSRMNINKLQRLTNN